ncbi:hypothetical protein Cs7R123_02960 [Catellatospora sp. TT07R-123]|uniref:DinB family protein n=1 Tax=Catellatospora sp. TT07R-123 TaxID=2733863 RepID=UPI001B09A715|nr:DinB family protein [Catellatospora sp. TT07R-123]GHJ42954.1 hypothetical protein Cs7R123_02960 [Catellatospora sp. TT07R-123]
MKHGDTDPCPECGFDWAIAFDDAVAVVAATADHCRTAFAAASPADPVAGVWSPAQYLWHMVDVLRYGTERMWTLTLDPDAGVIAWSADLVIDEVRARSPFSVPVGLRALASAAAQWCDAALAAPADTRTAHPSWGMVDRLRLARISAHEIRHHELDIRRGLRRPPAEVALHHVAVQTGDLANSVAWYTAYFGATLAWSLDRFSPLTHERLPGITALSELVVGDLRFHLFERASTRNEPPAGTAAQFQHVCLRTASSAALVERRDHWLALYDSRQFTFARDEPATAVVVDDDGVESFYALDPNGLEFEFAYIPGTGR